MARTVGQATQPIGHPGQSVSRRVPPRCNPSKSCQRALAAATLGPDRTGHERPTILPPGILIAVGVMRHHRRPQSACRLPGVAGSTPALAGYSSPRRSRGPEPLERNAHNVRPACTMCRPSLADRHPATTDARPRPIPRACRRREPPSRNAIQRETGERPAPTDPAHPHAAPTEARAEPIARQPRTRTCRTHCHTTWYGGAPDRALGLAFTPTDRGSRRTAHLHPHPPRPQMLRTTTTPPPVADDTGNRTLYLTHPPANAPQGTLTTDHW